MRHSVVRSNAAIEAAFCSAVRVTFLGSTTGRLAVMSKLTKLTEEGFTFQSHLDGSKHHLSPEEAVRVQALIGELLPADS